MFLWNKIMVSSTMSWSNALSLSLSLTRSLS